MINRDTWLEEAMKIINTEESTNSKKYLLQPLFYLCVSTFRNAILKHHQLKC